MATLVFLHAHPDDEASSTSGSMARAVANGDRVVVIYATNGDLGEASEDGDGDVVAQRHQAAENSARVLGTSRVEWLGYCDSGMTGWDANANPDNFINADLGEAARKVADILDDEDADSLIGYDDHGNYGHPDHIRVHQVMNAAAALAKRPPRVLEVTMNRSAFIAMAEANAGTGGEWDDMDPNTAGDDGGPLGTLETDIDWKVDVTDYLDKKRAALECHAAQTSDVGMMLSLPPELFAMMFGYEYYIDPANHHPGGEPVEGWPW